MMLMEQIYNQTVEIKELVTGYDSSRRDEVIGQLRKLLDERGRLTGQLAGRCSDEDRVLGEKIVAMNQEINRSLQSIKMDIVGDMRQFKHRKRSVKRYRNPYTGPTKDGMFLDKRE